MTRRLQAVFLAATAVITFSLGTVLAADATTPGDITVPYPTLTNLAVEWEIEGDENLNATASVEYRIKGTGEWSKGMDLRRVPAGQSADARRPFIWKDKLSGSIFDLRPDTEYEIRVKLSDPDGGGAEKLLTGTTRPVPRPAADAVVKQVNPRSLRQEALDARPGDILELAPGYYGNLTFLRDGEPGRPIVIRSDRSNEIVNSTFDRIDLGGRSHIILDGVTVFGSVELTGARDIAVRHCTVRAKYGIIAKESPGARNCYIADNDVEYVMPWIGFGMGCCLANGGAACVGEGIQLTGPGNVICYNRVKGYRDCISFMEDLPVYEQRCIDVYNNDVYVGADDGIEADFAQGNCRIMRNRLTNCFIALSSQPGLGGPTYFIRNVMYNIVNNAFKLSRTSQGDVMLHNSVVKVGDGLLVSHNPQHALFRNNLTVGGTGGDNTRGGTFGLFGSGMGDAVSFRQYNETVDMDYGGYGTHGTPFRGVIGSDRFSSIGELNKITGGSHNVRVDMSVFNSSVEFPDPAIPEREPAELSLRPGSAAVDAAQVIPNINDNYTGDAPDLGAYELGAEIPHYGPRPRGVDEETMYK